MKRCKKCIMPETAKGIKFDKKGNCSLCIKYSEFTPKGEDELKKELADYLNSESECNCIVPVSGGRDSAYALYYSKRILGLKPLAVHNDNDFETDTATRNLFNMASSLEVPLIRVSSKNSISKKIVAEKFKMNARYGPDLVVSQTCEACEYGFRSAAFTTAKKRGINVVIWGDSTDESTKPYHELIEHETPNKWQRLLSPEALNFLRYKFLMNKMKKEYGEDFPQDIKEIHLYDYIKWDRRVIVDAIQKELKWVAPDDSPTSWRIDCSLVPLINYLTEKAYGVSKIELGFSNMVRSGKMDREEAIRQASEIKKNTDVEQMRRLLNEMGVPVAVVNKTL